MSVYEQMADALCPKRRTRRMCAEAFGVEEHRLVGACRRREIIIPRHATYYVLRERFPDMSLPWIGRFMGGRDHSTILRGIRAIKDRMERDAALQQTVMALVKGRLPEDHNAHVMRWLVEQAYRKQLSAAPVPKPALLADPDSSLAEYADMTRLFCGQCDRAVTGVEAVRCSARLCGLRPGGAAAVGLQGRQAA